MRQMERALSPPRDGYRMSGNVSIGDFVKSKSRIVGVESDLHGLLDLSPRGYTDQAQLRAPSQRPGDVPFGLIA